uniref:Uncharacterized protein n=1 Tax=Castor canadensis TaxID=51338 RepID=A0A8C0ZNR1_CASCN
MPFNGEKQCVGEATPSNSDSSWIFVKAWASECFQTELPNLLSFLTPGRNWPFATRSCEVLDNGPTQLGTQAEPNTVGHLKAWPTMVIQ